MAHTVKTLHVTPVEYVVIRAAADALEMELSRLVLEGVLEEAHRMGFFVGVEPPIRRRPKAWTDLPERREQSTSMRFSVSYSLTTFDLLHRVAAYVQVSDSLFAVGATLRYIANLKKTPPTDRALRKLKLPAQYE